MEMQQFQRVVPCSTYYKYVMLLANMELVFLEQYPSDIAQQDIQSVDNPKPIDYKALEECLSKAGVKISENGGSIHMPRIGCGLVGGNWEEVEPLIEAQLLKRGINVTVYDNES
jgi:hypothetical protein